MFVSILKEQTVVSLSSSAKTVDTKLTRISMLLEMSVMTIFSPLPTGRRSRGQSIPRMFQEILFPSYKPHPLVGVAVDRQTYSNSHLNKVHEGRTASCAPLLYDWHLHTNESELLRRKTDGASQFIGNSFQNSIAQGKSDIPSSCQESWFPRPKSFSCNIYLKANGFRLLALMVKNAVLRVSLKERF
jgi:hypothetical protein